MLAALLVTAAMQEAVEHTGELDDALYRKIRDRYPLRLQLTQTHVRDLLARHVLIKSDGYDDDVGALIRSLSEALPEAADAWALLADIYPIHPATLALLEEVRDRFSQTRGVVDFVVRRLAGDPVRGIEPFLDREWGALLTPDRIVEHFADALDVQAEFRPLSARVLPWYRDHLAGLFDKPKLRELAERVLRLLVLVWLSPARDRLTAEEATHWLTVAASRIDPRRNRDVVARVLERLATEGRHVVRSGEGYALDVRDDGAAEMERRVQRELAQLPSDAAILDRLVDELEARTPGGGVLNPPGLSRGRWLPRSTEWKHHDRRWSLWVGEDEEPPPPGPCLCIRLPWGSSVPASCPTVVPSKVEAGPAARELFALLRVREGGAPAEAGPVIERRIAERLEGFSQQIRQAYIEGEAVIEGGVVEPGPSMSAGLDTRRWLDAWALWLLRRRYPRFETFAPNHGLLPDAAMREFMRFASANSLAEPVAPQWVTAIREGYLVPMQLVRRGGRGYEIPRLDRCELVRLVRPLAETRTPIEAVYDHLAQPVYGLVPDQVHVLLAFLVLQGEIDVVTGEQSYRTAFETFPVPRLFERLVPGRSLGSESLRSLERLAAALKVGTAGLETAQGQRRAIRGAGETLAGFASRLAAHRSRLAVDPLLGERLDRVLAACGAFGPIEEEFAALERFLGQVESVSAFVAQLDDLRDLPNQIERRERDLQRIAHLFGQPGAETIAESLGSPPSLVEGSAVDAWIARADDALDAYRREYRTRHDRFWAEAAGHPAFGWAPPRVASSRHAGLGPEREALARFGAAARAARCRGMSNLIYQMRCGCGFDGERAATSEALREFEAVRERIEADLRGLFAREEVRARVRAAVEDGVDRSAGTAAYLEGEAPWPDPPDLSAFDRHLSGVEVVRHEPVERLVALATERVWEPGGLVRAIETLLRSIGAERIRFEAAPVRDADETLLWCMEQALRHGATLPAGLGDTAAAADRIDPGWVGAAAQARLEDLGLAEACLDRIAGWILDTTVPAARRRSPAAAAVLEIKEPSVPADPEALAALAERMYRFAPMLMRIAPDRARERLDALARTMPEPVPPPLAEAIAAEGDEVRVMIDAFGLPLLGMVRAALPDLFPGRRVRSIGFGLAPLRSSTEAFRREVLEAASHGEVRSVGVLDDLIHGRGTTFVELERLALAELRVALGRLLREVPVEAPLVVFGDHGFRLDPSGRGWTHGGPSALERIVPVIRLSGR